MEERAIAKRRLLEPQRFHDYATIFKLSSYPDGYRALTEMVHCVSCGAAYSISDLLTGELEETECPACGITAAEYYADKPHQEVPSCPEEPDESTPPNK